MDGESSGSTPHLIPNFARGPETGTAPYYMPPQGPRQDSFSGHVSSRLIIFIALIIIVLVLVIIIWAIAKRKKKSEEDGDPQSRTSAPPTGPTGPTGSNVKLLQALQQENIGLKQLVRNLTEEKEKLKRGQLPAPPMDLPSQPIPAPTTLVLSGPASTQEGSGAVADAPK